MTATANIQNIENTATQKTNKMQKDGEMNNEININMVARISNTFPIGNIGKLVLSQLGLGSYLRT